MKIGKRGLVILSAGGLLIGTLSFVGAQSTQSGGAEVQTQDSSQTQDASSVQRLRGFGHGFGLRNDSGRGFRGLPFGHLALGTTVTLEFYNTNPDTANDGASGTPQQTLSFTYGQDSEAAFAQNFAEAQADASYMVVNVGEQTQTLELPSPDSADTSIFGRGDRHGGVYGALSLRALNEGSSIEATFYDGDPAANGQSLQTLTFTYGEDSEAGFAGDFASAAEEAAFVTLTTSPQTYTVDLSAISDRMGDSRGRDTFRRGGDRLGHHR